jgi:glutaredoxin 3
VEKDFQVEYFDVQADASHLASMLKYSSGQRRVPVIVEGDRVTVGYGGT